MTQALDTAAHPSTVIVNDLLDTLREEYGVTSDEALARELSQRFETISDMAIYRWRRGNYSSKAVRILLPLAIERAPKIPS